MKLRGGRRAIIALGALAGVSTAVLAFQTYRVSELQRQVRLLSEQKAKPLPFIPPVLDDAAPAFAKSVRKTVPDIFWGEFAEDVHDCGTAQSFVITDRKLMVKEDQEERVEGVRWTKPKFISLTTQGSDFLKHAFDMELSPDSNEITFIYTNMKVIRQRCSARAHEDPDEALANVDIAMNAADTDY